MHIKISLMMSHKHLLLRLMFFRQNFEYLLHNCLFLNFEWSIVLEIGRTKEMQDIRGDQCHPFLANQMCLHQLCEETWILQMAHLHQALYQNSSSGRSLQHSSRQARTPWVVWNGELCHGAPRSWLSWILEYCFGSASYYPLNIWHTGIQKHHKWRHLLNWLESSWFNKVPTLAVKY